MAGFCEPVSSEEGELRRSEPGRGPAREPRRLMMRTVNRLERSAVETMIRINREEEIRVEAGSFSSMAFQAFASPLHRDHDNDTYRWQLNTGWLITR